MGLPMKIDFAVAVPDEAAAHEVARVAHSRGYEPSPYYDDETRAWTTYCARIMVATYDAVVAAQAELEGLSRPFGGHCDGWGTSGNVDEE